jgi:hypothetical protein
MFIPGQPPAARNVPAVAATTNRNTTRSLNKTTMVSIAERHPLLVDTDFLLGVVVVASALPDSDRLVNDILCFLPNWIS